MPPTGPDRVDVFCRGDDLALWSRSWTSATQWGPWQRLGGQLFGDVEATVHPGEAVPEVYAAGLDLALWRYRWIGDRWQVSRVAST